MVPAGFRKLVEQRMEAQHLSLRGLARRAGISPSFLSRILSGERGLPEDEVILKLAKALCVQPPALLFLEAGRIPARSLDRLSEEEIQRVLEAIQDLINRHQRPRKGKRAA